MKQRGPFSVWQKREWLGCLSIRPSLLFPARVGFLSWKQRDGRGSPATSFLLPGPAFPADSQCGFSFCCINSAPNNNNHSSLFNSTLSLQNSFTSLSLYSPSQESVVFPCHRRGASIIFKNMQTLWIPFLHFFTFFVLKFSTTKKYVAYFFFCFNNNGYLIWASHVPGAVLGTLYISSHLLFTTQFSNYHYFSPFTDDITEAQWPATISFNLR